VRLDRLLRLAAIASILVAAAVPAPSIALAEDCDTPAMLASVERG
jgi:hypothetical protein